MKTHPLSTACAYAMLASLIVFGLAGIVLEFPEKLPPHWAPLLGWAETSLIASLITAFLAASIASMRAVAHAERAWEAGAGSRRIFAAATIYAAGCIVIEVALSKFGAAKLGIAISTAALTAALIFFALAPRIVAFVLAGINGLEKEEEHVAREREHRHDLERIRATCEETDTRIARGVANLDAHRFRAAAGRTLAAGAGAALIAMSMSGETQAQPQHLTHEQAADTVFPYTERVVESPMVRGPRATNEEKYRRMAKMLTDNPNISNRRLARDVGVHRTQIRYWRQHWKAQQVLAHEQNLALLDAA